MPISALLRTILGLKEGTQAKLDNDQTEKLFLEFTEQLKECLQTAAAFCPADLDKKTGMYSVADVRAVPFQVIQRMNAILEYYIQIPQVWFNKYGTATLMEASAYIEASYALGSDGPGEETSGE